MSSDLRHRLGHYGERLAAQHLERRGFAVLDRNYRTRSGELDLVVFDGAVLAFCEVKTRRQGAWSPFDTLSDAQRERLRGMALTWLKEVDDRPRPQVVRFDLIAVVIDAHGKLVRLDHVEDAF
jgi:putative endonuclease